MSRKIGAAGEQAAREFLEKQGMQILAMNYHSRLGEVDIIARENEWVVFVEVKQRKYSSYGQPGEAVDVRKQQRIIKTALQYLQANDLLDSAVRFDVVEILPGQLRHIPGAFDATELE